MGMKHEDIVRKIKSLLARAEHEDTTPAEAAASLAKAQTLMAKYEVEEFEARTAGETPRVNETFVPYVSTRIQTWETVLADAIGKLFDCNVLSYPVSTKFGFIGTELNRETGIYAFEAIRNRLLALLEDAKKLRPSYENPKAYRTSWLLGAATTISLRARQLRLAREQGEKSESTTALTIVKGREIQDFIRSNHPDVSEKTIDASYGSRAGLNGGLNAGSLIDIEGAGLSGSQQRRLS